MPAPPAAVNPGSGPLLGRLIAALFLNRRFYEAAAVDAAATGPAGALLCIIALIRQSVTIWQIAQVHPLWGIALLVVVALALVSWLLLGGIGWLVARLGAPQPVGYTRLLRCLGFGQAPTILLPLAYLFDPSLYWLAHLGLLAWTFAGMFVAMRAATATGPGRAVLLTIPVFLVQQVLLALQVFLLLG